MRCVVGIDLGSTTTKALLLDEKGEMIGRGITNSRSNYDVACAVAREEALTGARFSMLGRAMEALEGPGAEEARKLEPALLEAFRAEVYLDQLEELRDEILGALEGYAETSGRSGIAPAAAEVLDEVAEGAPALFGVGVNRKSDFFRDLAAAAFMHGAERVCQRDGVPFEHVIAAFDRAILKVETRTKPRDFGDLMRRAAARCLSTNGNGNGGGAGSAEARKLVEGAVRDVIEERIEELAFTGTGYGRQRLPFPKEAVRSEILCHGRGAHRVFPETRTVLDIGGQDTKAIQVNEFGVVTSFQMNDRCAAGCGRYLGYIADELNIGLHELGPLALRAQRKIKVNSTCTVFAGAELRERLALGQQREDILAGLHRSIILRALSLLARSGGIQDEFTFTGGVCKNPMATKILGEMVVENYGDEIQLNIHPDSIYMGALGAALFALDDVRAGRPRMLPTFVEAGDTAASS